MVGNPHAPEDQHEHLAQTAILPTEECSSSLYSKPTPREPTILFLSLRKCSETKPKTARRRVCLLGDSLPFVTQSVKIVGLK